MAEEKLVTDLEQQYDQMFAYRYTDEDPDYKKTAAKSIPPCPCVSGYYTKSKKNFDNRQQTMAEEKLVTDLEQQYDQMFAYRYTDEDPDYKKTAAKSIPPCPCVSGYYTKSKKNFDNSNQGGRSNWRNQGQNQWSGQHQKQYNHRQGQRGRDDGWNRGSYDRDNRDGDRHHSKW